MKLLINGAERASDLPGFNVAEIPGEVCFAPDTESLERFLPGTDVLLGWNFRGKQLQECWQAADSLKWVHWCGAGVDAVLFPEFIESDVTLTNARGIFDRAMAEYVLAYMLYESKRFPETLKAQAERRWEHKLTSKLAGQSAGIFGVGSIGREIAKVLKAIGVEVVGVGRSERDDELFGTIHSAGDVLHVAARVDWVIGILPSTPASDGFFTAEFFAAMKDSAHFINVGRGRAQDEDALIKALKTHEIAGAMLDVFGEEPLPPSSALWTAPKLLLSPHMSGDYKEFQADLVNLFMKNLQQYKRTESLFNVVDKRLGFVVA